MREFISFGMLPARKVLAVAGLGFGSVLSAIGRRDKAARLLSSVHRGAASPLVSKAIENYFRSRTSPKVPAERRTLLPVYRRHVTELPRTQGSARFLDAPLKLLGARVIVLKRARPNEKGVLVVDYSFAFPLFAKLFDLEEITRRYHIVLEPSWSGYCDLDILCYAQYEHPVFVQAYEPRDGDFLRSLQANLIPVPVAANWWVDHRVMRPLEGVKKDADLIMVASWARFKRHHRVFAALARLRRKGHHLKTILIGYPIDCSRDDIYRMAGYYGIADQVEMYEWLSPEEVNAHFNRARVNIIWSRKEGVNRTIIEGMFAGVPCIVRDGFNFGYRYPYINPMTGCFAGEADLADRLVWMAENHHTFRPREWILKHMSCQKATEILERSIREVALAHGEAWTEGLAVKVCELNTMKYWDPSEKARFEGDYGFLQSMLKKE
ncbi:MAG: glycosyltransferase [Gemmataceae bacterium]|nr:glycosyltransferase [Gemmataceae bacterium]